MSACALHYKQSEQGRLFFPRKLNGSTHTLNNSFLLWIKQTKCRPPRELRQWKWVSPRMFSLSCERRRALTAQGFPHRRGLHWMQHQGAGPDPRVNPVDEVKQKAEGGYPGPGGRGGLWQGMLLTLLTELAPPPQSAPIPSLIRKKDPLGAPSPGRHSICAQAQLNWCIFPHYSRRPLLHVARAEGEERDREALRLRAECLSCPALLPLIWLGLQSSIHKPCLEPPNACLWTRENMQCIIRDSVLPVSLSNRV